MRGNKDLDKIKCGWCNTPLLEGKNSYCIPCREFFHPDFCIKEHDRCNHVEKDVDMKAILEAKRKVDTIKFSHDPADGSRISPEILELWEKTLLRTKMVIPRPVAKMKAPNRVDEIKDLYECYKARKRLVK